MSYQNAIVLQDLPERKPVRVPVGDVAIILVREQQEVKAFQAQCPHSGAPLEQGTCYGDRLVCPWHKANFSLKDGSLCEPLALSDLQRYSVRVENGMVQVDPQPLPPLMAFSTAQEEPVFVILGSGAAGAAAAWTLRREGFKGKVILVDRESEAPYDRTVLTKFLPAGNMEIDEVPRLLEADFYRFVERRQAEVARLESKGQRLRFADGSTLDYDKLLIATGGIPQRPDIAGKALFGVHVLRSLEQADSLLNEVDKTKQIVIIGNSFIGMELASALRTRKVKVQVIASDPLPFRKIFGDQIARYFRELHEEKGVEFVEGKVTGLKDDKGHVSAVMLKSGQSLPADSVLLATGVVPATSFIHDIPLNDDGSLMTDAYLAVSNQVWSAGDIATFPNGAGNLRIEHWRVAQQQGRIAAKNMLGQKVVFDCVPFFWTAQFGTRYEYLGHAEQWDDYQLLGSLKEKKFVALYGQKGRLAAVASCGLYTFTAGLLLRMQQPVALNEAVALAKQALN